jgi:ankyrin repeat protein
MFLHLLRLLTALLKTVEMTSTSKDDLIALASAGDLSQLETILSKEKESPLDGTVQELLATAATESHTDVVNFLLTKYTSVRLNEAIVRSAVNSGSIPVMKALLAREPSAINMPFDHYGSPLIVACMRRKNIDYLQYLLEAGADPNQDPDAATFPLAIVAALYKDPAVIDILLQYGAKLERSGALGAAAQLGNEPMMARLLEREARSDTDAIRLSERGSPLHTAVEAGHVGVTRMLLQHGADPKALDGNGMTPLDVAEKMQEKGKDMSQILEILR